MIGIPLIPGLGVWVVLFVLSDRDELVNALESDEETDETAVPAK